MKVGEAEGRGGGGVGRETKMSSDVWPLYLKNRHFLKLYKISEQTAKIS